MLGGVIIGLGVASMHYIGMSAIRVQDSLSYNPMLVAASVIIAIIAGTAALWAALRLHSLLSTIVASLIMGVAVSGMHYTGMAALRVYPAPGLTVNTSATASALAFLLPLILGLSMVGFIFSTVIALSPTAAEIVEEGELMARIARTSQYEPSVGPGRRLRPLTRRIRTRGSRAACSVPIRPSVGPRAAFPVDEGKLADAGAVNRRRGR